MLYDEDDVIDSHRQFHIKLSQVIDLYKKKPAVTGWIFCCLANTLRATSSGFLMERLAWTRVKAGWLGLLILVGDPIKHKAHVG